MSDDLSGKSALVTGASRGIGFAVAAELLRRGANVVISARKPEPLEEAAERLRGLGHPGKVVAVAGNSGDAAARAEQVATAVAQFGSLDVLINNTGINPVFGPMVELDLDAARKIVEVNCLAALSWVQHAYRAWMKDHGGAVVNVSSVAGLKPAPCIGF
ncbi:SDR family NAD(P)-dependent oxidoreductase [Streptomyces sp. NPDC059083]|uniref:SDR family NAD(P)-dependent oxidoreductase n=1 Tax=Streptomyces sp. NPDC059083 TaxID=3346721 RepID=UPI003679119E